jgi:hypothetical protein
MYNDKIFATALGKLITLTVSLLVTSPLFAFPFPFQNARTAALGGAGVAIDVRNAPFANPALMATGDENYDWIIMLPSRGEIESEVDEFDPGLISDQDVISKSRFNSVSVVVPNETISAVAFFKKIEYESAKFKLGSPSVVEHRAIIVQEQGVSLAKLLHDPYIIPFQDVMFGVNMKLSLIKAYGYDDPVIGGGSSFDPSQGVDQTGSVNFDIGLAKEYGVWKMGLVVKDVFSFEHEYADSKEFYKVKPLIRIGFAYLSRKTLWEIDGDVTTNLGVVHQSETKFIAMGFEHELLPGWYIRFGLRKNTVGDELTTQTAGIGFNYFGIEINFATLKNSVEQGGFSQIIVEF